MSQNWRTEVDALDYFGHQRRQLNIADRRPVIRRPSDLVGPGIAQHAIRTTNFNDPVMTYNGFFSALAGAANAPTGTGAYAGWVSSDAEVGGVQMFTNLSTGVTYRRVFARSAVDPEDPSSVVWGAWGTV